LPKRNYGFEKRQKELDKKRKKEEKRQRRLDRAAPASENPVDDPAASTEPTPEN
jgi:hypothetical protein